MSKVVFEGQPELNADEEKLVEILGDDGISQMLELNLTDGDFSSLRIFDNSDVDDIDFDKVNFDNVVLATVIGYERAVKEVASDVRPELVQIAKDYKDVQERRLIHGNAGDDETPTHLVQRAELDGIIRAYEVILNTPKTEVDNYIAQVSFNIGQAVQAYRLEFSKSTGEQYSRELEDFGVDFDTGETVENIISNEAMMITLSSLKTKLNNY